MRVVRCIPHARVRLCGYLRGTHSFCLVCERLGFESWLEVRYRVPDRVIVHSVLLSLASGLGVLKLRRGFCSV